VIVSFVLPSSLKFHTKDTNGMVA